MEVNIVIRLENTKKDRRVLMSLQFPKDYKQRPLIRLGHRTYSALNQF
jgi:hypothetical protein